MLFSLRNKGIFIIAAAVLVLLGIYVLFRVSTEQGSKFVPSPHAPDVNLPLEDFFGDYWQRPIPLQGPPPGLFSPREASLKPEDCGGCHTQQYADWKETLHSKAMGPGPWGQILDLQSTSPADAVLCMTCHAPLSEQLSRIPQPSQSQGVTYESNPQFDSQLQLRGITCAACHVRAHQRFGPPKAEEANVTPYPLDMPNHGGVKRTLHFEKAEFCKDCHQFDPENSMLVNGKPLQDTFREWKRSIWGEGGAACQSCHMPERRHLWKGIHDKNWVKEAVRVDATLEKTFRPGETIELRVAITNAAVGHKFPSYITPKIFVRAALLDHQGKTLPQTERESVIGWDARFEGGQWVEHLDTRIHPGDTFRESIIWNASTAKAKSARVWVEVHPDHFYHVHFYPAYLQGQNLSPEGRRLIEKALEESGRTPYLLFEKNLPLA